MTELLLGAHPDDIESGMGGYLSRYNNAEYFAVIATDTLNYKGNDTILDELKTSMNDYKIQYEMLGLTNMSLHLQKPELCEYLYKIKQNLQNITRIFCTNPFSSNPDHAILAEACKAVFQEHSVLFYEVIRGDYKFIPNMYVKLSEKDLADKVRHIRMYHSQDHRYYFDLDVLNSMAKFRGSQINTKYAESFMAERIIE